MKYLIFFAVLFSVRLVYGQSVSPTLKLGSNVPQINNLTYVMGDTISLADRSRIHVIEFSNTGCPPCIAGLSHTTQLAKIYSNKVDFLNIFIYQNEQGTLDLGYQEHVRKIIKLLENKISFSVAIDDAIWTNAKNWMQAAGVHGIPTAFIVNKEGKIVWIGNPMRMDGALKIITKNVATVEGALKVLDLEYRTEKDNNWVEFAHGLNNYLSEGGDAFDVGDINDFAWLIFQQTSDTKALGLALRWIKKVVEEKKESAFFDTYANLLYKAGFHKKGIEAESDALRYASEAEKGVYLKSLKKMQNEIK